MIFGGWALFTGVSHMLAACRANVEDTDRGLTTTMAAADYAGIGAASRSN
jgi:hypothetical protein